MIAFGIDQSTKATGLVVLEGSKTDKPKLLLEDVVSIQGKSGFDLYEAAVTCIVERIVEFKPQRLVLEGYSLNFKHPSSVVPLVELGTLLRFMLRLDGHSWLAPRAGELKKFVIGKGNGAKDQMMMFVLHRWGHMSKTNDTADAFGLAAIGLAHGGCLLGATKEMRTVACGLQLRCN